MTRSALLVHVQARAGVGDKGSPSFLPLAACKKEAPSFIQGDKGHVQSGTKKKSPLHVAVQIFFFFFFKKKKNSNWEQQTDHRGSLWQSESSRMAGTCSSACKSRMAWNLPRSTDLGLRHHLWWFVDREGRRWLRGRDRR
jgi:hypothetical protein